MNNQKLKIGKIPYANLFPIFYTLERGCDCSSYEFVEGVPSRLNKMLHAGEIDISPSSSIEYIKNQSLYRIIDNHSISSKGPVGSISLFTAKPVAELNGAVIYVSSQSETSVALLDIILRRFYGVQCLLQASERPEQSGDAFLLIGDDALKQQAKGKGQEATGKKHSLSPIAYSQFVYDLGEIWYEKTGLPFVFALWIVRAELYKEGEYKQELLNKFIKDLNAAKESALNNLPEIARHAPMKAFMSEEDILRYWNKLDYELTGEHKKGLELFKEYII